MPRTTICGLPSMVSVVMFEAELTTVSTLTRLRFMLGPHWWIPGNKKGRQGDLMMLNHSPTNLSGMQPWLRQTNVKFQEWQISS
ncbi:hypothetical protein VU597_03905 [Citrobacter portucalensis]